MSIFAAVQSAVFYVVSCAPCLQARHHQQSKVQAKKERREKARIQAENPDSYQHPDPFNTNPYWAEEIMMGPHVDVKKYKSAASKNPSQRGLHSSGKDTASVTGSVGAGSMHIGSSPTIVGEEGKLSFSTTLTPTLSEDWNRKRYQREDEELWGHELSRTGHKLMDAIKHAGSSAGRLLENSLGMESKQTTDDDKNDAYFVPKNPPVNEYHPPIVRQRPTHRDAHKWMLQPPPPAKFMEGKVPVSRSASFASHMSRRTVRTATSDGPALGRLVHEKTVEAKLKSGAFSSEVELNRSPSRPATKRQSTASSNRRLSIQRATRRKSFSSDDSSSESEDDLPTPARRRISRAKPTILLDLDSSSDEDDYFLVSSDSFGRGKKAAARPRLQPIISSQQSESGSKHATTPDNTSSHPELSALADVSNSRSPSEEVLKPAASTTKPTTEVSV
ncbi:hypothetical protein F4809DRAFT_157718 [Biscogniauxia mediterranea]|nr:hypothetical protein F4809DRAFT_157718 [Biscogniauxia mediterranea]